jgi:hypothetical protein
MPFALLQVIESQSASSWRLSPPASRRESCPRNQQRVSAAAATVSAGQPLASRMDQVSAITRSARDAEFSRDFIVRHRSKLIFGSDCSCTDDNGAGISKVNNPEAVRLNGKCVARATLGLLKESTTPEIFRAR